MSFTERRPRFVQLHEEDFGITVVEALACGCPVMVHCTGGHAEIVTDGVGVQVDAENEDAIDEGLVRLLEHPWDAAQAVEPRARICVIHLRRRHHIRASTTGFLIQFEFALIERRFGRGAGSPQAMTRPTHSR